MDTYYGTKEYCSPQLLENVPFTSKCDVWSLGVIYYLLLCGKYPGGSKNFKIIY